MLYRLSSWHAAGPLLAVFCILGPSVGSAQSGDPEHGELAAFGAVATGAGTQPVVGASAGAAFSRYGMGLFEFSFMPLGRNTIQPWPDPATLRSSLLYDFAVEFHVRIPVKDRWEPYAIAGTGLLWNVVKQDAGRNFNQFNAALHTGGGVRCFVGKSWGFRPEVKVIVSKAVYTRVSLGVFYVTPPDWP